MISIDNAVILIVDDVPQNIQVLGNILKSAGLKFEFATNGKDALEWVKNARFDLILLDIMMPGMDGFEVCRQLKADRETADIPVIFLSAKVETEDVVTGFNAGAVDYVTKPFSQEELLARVSTHIKLYRAFREIQFLRGILPICSYCKKIRDDKGYWEQVDVYFANHSKAEFSHSICPDCYRKYYPELCDEEDLKAK